MRRFNLRLSLLTLVGLLALSVVVATAAPNGQPVPRTFLPLVMKPKPVSFGYGQNLSRPSNSHYVSEMGFGWVKYHLKWSDSEPYAKGHYDWTDADPYPWDSYAGNYVRDTAPGLKILMRVDSPPAWANGGGNGPPRSPRDYGDFMQALATFLRGKVSAYEIWNEPNLSSEWGGRTPSPAEYTALLKEAYRGVKAGDPNAQVISAGLATTGGGGGAMNDVTFVEGMYTAGAKGSFDALGSHPYGFGSTPETDPWGQGILFFRRAEEQRAVMERYGDGARQIWATEFGWLLDPAQLGSSCRLPSDRDWQKQSPSTQAAYLQRAYAYAYTYWPWMGPMFTFNLDFSDLPTWWLSECDQMRWYSVTGAGNSLYDGILSARPAYSTLGAMPKPTVRP